MNNNIKSNLTVQQKLAAKQTAHNIRFGSPKLRDLLRERCRIRIKESRGSAFNNFRNLTATEQELVQTVVNDELKEMDFDIVLQDVIYKEIIDEVDQWLFNVYETEETNLINSLTNTKPIVFCPVCQINEMLEMDNEIICTKCHIKFDTELTLEQFHRKILNKSIEHEFLCANNLTYFAEPLTIIESSQSQLNAICNSCDYFYAF